MIYQFLKTKKYKYNMLFLKLLPFFFIMFFSLPRSFSVSANSKVSLNANQIKIFGISQQDLNDDGFPDVTEISCAFATNRDRVLVYDQNGDMTTGNRWQDITDFNDDIWVFDGGADGTAQLIVDFDIEDGQYVAMIYDDLNGDGQVDYRIEGNHVNIEKSSFWHVKVISKQSWSKMGNSADTNLSFLIDGYAGLSLYMGNSFGIQGDGRDGLTDWEIDIGDKDGDGINDYQMQRAIINNINDKHTSGYPATIYGQVTKHHTIPYTNVIFWPLLITKHNYEDYRYFDHSPAIAVDWQTGTIDQVGVMGFPIENGYHIYDRLPLEKKIINSVDYENPMAYYDMANDQDSWPELQVRFDVAVPHDPYFLYSSNAGKVETPNLEVNYSWDQDNDNRWDYKMNLSGNYSIDEVVNFPDFAIKSIPYKEIIPWVKNRTWDVATLVFDGHPSQDSEGMFGKGWMLNRGYADGKQVGPSGVRSEYLMGFSDRPPVENYQDIQDFMRGEYSFEYFDIPKMYLSALDRQLHLYNAQSGVWNLGGGHYLRYANLDGDAYLDQWQEQRDGTVVQQLNYSQGYYVYDSREGVLLKQSNGNLALFETQPPGSYEEWKLLEKQLLANQAAFSPEDFSAMLKHLGGPLVQIQGSVLRDYRLTPQGFRFVLALQPGFTFTGPDWLGLNGKPPGDYLVEFSHSFTLKPLTPAQIKVDLQPAGINEPKIYEQIPIQVNLTNLGLEDKANSHFLVEAQNGEESAQVISQTVSLLSQMPLRLEENWQPNKEGEWQLVARVTDQNGKELVETRNSILVQMGDLGSPGAIARLSSYGVLLPILALLLVSAFFSAAIFSSSWTKQN